VPADPRFDSLETRRLVIRRFRRADVDTFAAYRANPDVARYQGWEPSYTADEGAGFVAELAGIDPGTPGEWFQFALEDKAERSLIGDCGLRIDEHDASVAELGFTLAKERQGRGLATEAVLAVLAYSFDRLGVRRVLAVTDARNDRSISLLERVGMRRIETRRVEFKNESCDELVYEVALPVHPRV
jgi:RimJ/RimL family protein N-acetyltransferase